MSDKETGTVTHPKVAVPPPLIIGVPFVIGMVLQWYLPFRFPPHWIGLPLGIWCVLGAAVLQVSSYLAFWRARTTLLPTRANRVLIRHGPFRFTRNPLYLGLILLYAGVALIMTAVWLLLFLPLVTMALHYLAVLPEEKYLEHTFGDEYRIYKARVRRWL